MYVYIRSEPGLWTVGFYRPDGSWEAESDHASQEAAAQRVRHLNGGAPPWTDSLARELAMLRPDRGNRYAPRSVRTKGEAAYKQWQGTCDALANWIARQGQPFDRDRFLWLCSGEDGRETIAPGDERYYRPPGAVDH